MTQKELIDNILNYSTINHFSDIHIRTNDKVKIRNKVWDIENLENIEIDWKTFLLPEMTLNLIKSTIVELIWNTWYEVFVKTFEYDSSYMIESWERFRVNCYMDTEWLSIAMRRIPNAIPTLWELGFWKTLEDLCNKSKWLILVTWPTWSWKSTNLAAMIDYINKNHKKHIITIEDPVEFSFKWDKSLINQREVWHHTTSFENAIRAALREDPDVIMVWEMRDPETIKAAITLAETWHLVLSTLHTNDSVQTIDRIVDIFPSSQQKQIRMQLAMNLAWVISQRLLPRADVDWRIAAREILLMNDAVRNLIITSKTHQLYSVLEVSHKQWMILMDQYLQSLFEKNYISKETLMSYVRDKEGMEMMLDQ